MAAILATIVCNVKLFYYGPAIQTVSNEAGGPTDVAYRREPSGCVATPVEGFLPALLQF
jgi:hypothetical protein